MVRVAVGTPQDLGTHLDEHTRAMRMPDLRPDSSNKRFDSVRAGPHRPFLSGSGESGLDSATIHVIYDARQMYVSHIIEFTVNAAPSTPHVAAALAGADPLTGTAAAAAAAAAAAMAPAASSRTASGGGGGSSSGGGGPSSSAGTVSLSYAALASGAGPPPAKRARTATPPTLASFVALLQSGSATDKRDAAFELGQLAATSDERKAAIATAGAIVPLVALVQSGSAKGKCYAALALGQLAVGSEERCAAIATAAGFSHRAGFSLLRGARLVAALEARLWFEKRRVATSYLAVGFTDRKADTTASFTAPLATLLQGCPVEGNGEVVFLPGILAASCLRRGDLTLGRLSTKVGN